MNYEDFDYNNTIMEENLAFARIKLDAELDNTPLFGITTWNRVPLDLFTKDELIELLTLLVEKLRKDNMKGK